MSGQHEWDGTAGAEARRGIGLVRWLLDHQVDDARGRHLGKVDDLELTTMSDGTVVVTALLSGPGALAGRLGGRLGTIWAAVWRRAHPSERPEPIRTPIELVVRAGSRVQLGAPAAELDFDRSEAWLRDHIVEALPGADHAPG
ncbi:MAG: hypothetical protein U0P45_07585 [Acidimicrobiales bacterium]